MRFCFSAKSESPNNRLGNRRRAIIIEIEIDTENEQDLNTIEELMEKLRELKELMYE